MTGTANRTVASTAMNATSSRAHTVVTITFDQILKSEAGETKKSSVINLVDLAGTSRCVQILSFNRAVDSAEFVDLRLYIIPSPLLFQWLFIVSH